MAQMEQYFRDPSQGPTPLFKSIQLAKSPFNPHQSVPGAFWQILYIDEAIRIMDIGDDKAGPQGTYVLVRSAQ